MCIYVSVRVYIYIYIHMYMHTKYYLIHNLYIYIIAGTAQGLTAYLGQAAGKSPPGGVRACSVYAAYSAVYGDLKGFYNDLKELCSDLRGF